METFRRIAVVAAIFVIAALALFLPRSDSDGYGIGSMLRGEERPLPRASEGYTPLDLPPMTVDEVPSLARINAEYSELARRTIPSVVSIRTIRSSTVPRYYVDPRGGVTQQNEQLRQPGLGSGVIVSEEGHVITNHHVVAGVDGLQIRAHDGREFPASLVGSDPVADIAVLKIEGNIDGLPPLPLGDSDRVEVGHSILAVGNPFGLSGTVTRGIVSAKERSLSDGAPELLQTDAVINPGNSGGPLLNIRGEVVGINVAIFRGQEGVNVWQGVGLAIPSNLVQHTFETIMSRGRPIFGYLGVTVGRDVTRGAVTVTSVAEGSPAEKAMLLPGDQLLSFGGNPVKDAPTFVRRVMRAPIGEPIEMVVRRAGKQIQVDALIGERPAYVEPRPEAASTEAVAEVARLIGLRCRNLSPQERRRAGMAADTPGVLVVDTAKASPFYQALNRNDLILQINQLPVSEVSELASALKALKPGEQAVMFAIGGGQRRIIQFTPNEDRPAE